MPGVFVTATQDGVGKTAVACGLIGALRERGIKAMPFKPIETGWPGKEGSWPPDAAALRAACGLPLRLDEVSPYVFHDAMPPVLAADRANRPVELKFLDRCYESLTQRSDLVVVEATGGLATPILRDPWFSMADLAFNWGLPVILVVPPGADGLHQAILSVDYARRKGLSLLGIVVNGMSDDPAAPDRGNPETLAAISGIPLLGVLPRRPDVDIAAGRWQPMVQMVAKGIDLWRIQNLTKAVAR